MDHLDLLTLSDLLCASSEFAEAYRLLDVAAFLGWI